MSELLGARYRLDSPIGRGSSATVYAATDLRLNRSVSVKVFDPGLASDPGLRARFQRQAARAACLRHPHIAAILDAGFTRDLADGERPFVVTEPAGPLSLRGLLHRAGRLAPEQALSLARQVASALSYAHRQGVIHADVKPENVLLDAAGQRAKVVDFSLSFVSATTGLVTPRTIARRAAYLAPEQVRGEAVTPATDVYALGVLLYEMVVGRPPFLAATPQATAERRVREAARPAGLFDPSVPPPLEAAIGRALERAPEQRWVSMEDFDRQLRLLSEAQLLAPMSARSVGATPLLSGPTLDGRRRGRRGSLLLALPALAAVIALALGGGLALPLVQAGLHLGGFSPQVAVPYVVDLTVAEAEELANRRGLALHVVGEQPTDSVPRGVIIQQSPVAGERPVSGQALRVTVSSGVRVPDVRGESLAGATAQLAAMKWKVARVERGPQPGGAAGTVVLQHPPPGEIVSAPGEMALAVAEES